MLFRPSLLGLPLDSGREGKAWPDMASVMMDDDAAAGCAGNSVASCRCRPKANGG